MPPPQTPPPLDPPLTRWLGPAGAAILLIATTLWLAGKGLDDDVPASGARATAAWMILVPGGLAAAYLAAAIGWGRLLLPLIRRGQSALWLQAGLGLGLMLTLSHSLGVTGLLAGAGAGATAAQVIAWATILIGICLLVDQVVRGGFHPEHWPVLPPWAMLAAPGVAIMLIAAASPPGARLWATEHGAYDVLSYHLQLPKEWLQLGRIQPLEHNVYSFLPSYVESAFMHLGVMAAAVEGPDSLQGGTTLIAGEGTGLIAAQMLHVLLGILAAALTGRAAWMLITRAGIDNSTARFCGALAAAALLTTPWVIVVGSLAYNELAVLALGAAALIAAIDTGLGPIRRAVIAGALVGLACSAKPTAAITIGPVVGFLLLGMVRRDEVAPASTKLWIIWSRMAGWGSAAGLAVMLPWMIRNFLFGKNPVFPFATTLFGRAHWSAEQVGRYADAHRFDGSTVERFALLFSTGRGIMHPQWSILILAGLIGLAAACAYRPLRRTCALLAAGLLALTLGWLGLTHIQSRFLLPAALPLAISAALGAAAVISSIARGTLRPPTSTAATPRPALGLAARIIIAVLPLALAAHAMNIFLTQNSGRPNAAIHIGVGGFTGLHHVGDLAFRPPDERQAFLSILGPTQFINLSLDPESTVYLLGDATPLYYRTRILYHTTWDASPLGEALKAHPGRATGPAGAAWARRLHDMGVRHILLNNFELQRLIEKDNWYDPVVTRPLVGAWTGLWTDLVRAWPRTGQYLLELRQPPAGDPPPPAPATTEPQSGDTP